MVYYHDVPKVQLLPRDLDTILLCTHDLMLPDLPTMHTRMLLVAWELELDEVTEQAAKLLMLALQVRLSLFFSFSPSFISTSKSHFQPLLICG